jgi:argininosuccinate lyase
LDVQINKALNSQNNIMARKKRELVHQLEAIKENTEQERRKFQNMEDDFVKYCESILQKDI